MADPTDTFSSWLAQARITASRLSDEQRAVLQAAFRFRHTQGTDYYATRLLGHFLLHGGTGLKVAQLARLLGISRPTASRQQALSAKQTVQQAHHRMDGRPYGKLLPRYAGPIAGFLLSHPDASRHDTLDFIDQTFGVRVSTVALSKFLTKYGLDAATRRAASVAPAPPATSTAEPLPLPRPPLTPAGDLLPGVRVLAQGQPVPTPAPPFAARTQFAGAFVLMGQALGWLDVAAQCFAADAERLRRGLLTSVFAPVVGLERIWHLDEMEDVGFALLTGGRGCPTRHAIGGWRRHLPWYEVDAFCRRTSPWHLLHGDVALVSYDEHSIPRWTRKFHIPKGYVTTRNKYMRCDKLCFAYDLLRERYLAVRATPGDHELIDWAVPLTRQTLERGQPDYLHAVFDAGAGKSDAGVRALWDLAAEYPQLDVTVRACRYPTRVRRWKQVPAEQFVSYEEAGPFVGAPAKEIRIAETTTVLKGETAEQAVRTIVCREVVPGPKKDRWHPLYTTSDGTPYEDVLTPFRQRQHHEQAYRVGVYDEFLDGVPCGYDKESPDPHRPRRQRGPLQMMGWLVALVYNAVADWTWQLGGEFVGSHIRTLRRQFFNRPGQLYGTPEALIVQLDPFTGQEALARVIDQFNAARHRLPWLEDRQIVVSLTPKGQARSGP